MKEDILHYLWKYKLFTTKRLRTTNNKNLEILNAGTPNSNAGPDFFNSKIRIGGQVWVGNVEIHIKSSHWYLHGHHLDPNYSNIILHVVWKENKPVFIDSKIKIETLELCDIVSPKLISKYDKLITNKRRWINCEKQINEVNDFALNHWFEVLYFERLATKTREIESMIIKTRSDWEAILFKLLVKNFGLRINSSSFLNLANSIDFKIIRRERDNLLNLEALLLGQAGLIDSVKDRNYYLSLREVYQYLKIKYKLEPIFSGQFKFFRLRPSSFPTIRILQISRLYYEYKALHSIIMGANSLEDYYDIFQFGTSKESESKYNYSVKPKKTISKDFIDLLLINCIIPFKFIYQKHIALQNDIKILELIHKIKPEKNTIVNRFQLLLKKRGKKVMTNAFETQSLIQLKNNYCDENRCLSCHIGHQILKSKSLK